MADQGPQERISLEGLVKYPGSDAESTGVSQQSIEDVLSSYQPAYEPESGGLLGALKGRFAEGLISATRPRHYRPDVLEAKGFDKVRVLSDKLARFAQGFAGFPQDYTDEMVDETMYHSSDMIKGVGEGIAEGHGELGDVTGIVRGLEDTRDKERQIAEARTDMFALGLGRPQRYGHFVESKDRPSTGETDPESLYLDFKEGSDFKSSYSDPNFVFGHSPGTMRANVLGRHKTENKFKRELIYDEEGNEIGISGEPEYTSYYDLWDFAGKKGHGLGLLNTALESTGLYTPHEVYGRIPS